MYMMYALRHHNFVHGERFALSQCSLVMLTCTNLVGVCKVNRTQTKTL